ncbi:angiopoietin-related protein 2-like [Drosophila nasuta]|uniref:angiopoietin-related protein 2-like n=1 Tax=Drosophila nasuta TaxID=42062 RepID=UPI00295E7D04|nr:angiopoietin-related protein 2-like [Drosophila nasuta]
MTKTFNVLLLISIFQVLNVQANLLEILQIQNKLKKSYNDIEKLQATYKTKLKEAITRENENASQDLKSQINDELMKCREENSAFEVLNKIYAEQIEDLQRKTTIDSDAILKEKQLLIDEGLETISSYTTIINEQAKQIELLKEDLQVKDQIIFHLETKTQDITDKFKNLEDLSTTSITETDDSSCLAFGDSNDVHLIKIDDGEAFEVPCESRVAGNGWTVIQRRLDGSVKFNRNWLEYKEGFGNLSGEFFIGLEKLHRMTVARPHELYIHLINFHNESSYAHYDNIVIDGESELYTLRGLGTFEGNAGDSMRDNEQQKFSTYDRDNDLSEASCAVNCLGGWWYNKCGSSNLNGQYTQQDDYYDNTDFGIYWDEWLGPGYTMKAVQMLIRPKINTEK